MKKVALVVLLFSFANFANGQENHLNFPITKKQALFLFVSNDASPVVSISNKKRNEKNTGSTVTKYNVEDFSEDYKFTPQKMSRTETILLCTTCD